MNEAFTLAERGGHVGEDCYGNTPSLAVRGVSYILGIAV